MTPFRLKTSPHHFLTRQERDRVASAIHAAEAGTSGEIRVHIERRSGGNIRKGGDALHRAAELMMTLGMTATADRNAVLIYIALSDRVFAIAGDEGIHREVGGDEYWSTIRDAMAERFRKGEFCEGICEAIDRVGGKLRGSFPRKSDDRNELPDDISIEN